MRTLRSDSGTKREVWTSNHTKRPAKSVSWNKELIKVRYFKVDQVDSRPTTRSCTQNLNNDLILNDKGSKLFCKTCGPGKTFERIRDLANHNEAVHIDSKAFKCQYEGCNYACAVANNLSSHVKNVHLKLKPHRCQNPGCEAAFAYKADLKFHHEAVHLKIVHKCQFCEITFTDKKNRRKHEKKYHQN